ncbi:PadR family transcriptional regulator [Bacillus sp. SB49]|uniref:PadR family transcriptional regulator n=1 Tax=Bacillaceae TaxID=186817 RepID=UPI0002A4D8AF|nr:MULTISPECIES: helix-turn-helix transcriptional regulator [Bacillaceae]ELK45611.1 transcriptional regulator [Halobacillus sp. BAB-2008]QHT46076.1 PadR family transcriptional regulator [Bacillus sp. SB49]
MKVNKELLKGSTSILILSLLNNRPMYGYELIRVMEEKSNGVFSLKEGTLYPLLHSLEKNEVIESYWGQGDTGRKRKYYRLTAEGRVFMEEKREEWSTFKVAVDDILAWERMAWE